MFAKTVSGEWCVIFRFLYLRLAVSFYSLTGFARRTNGSDPKYSLGVPTPAQIK